MLVPLRVGGRPPMRRLAPGRIYSRIGMIAINKHKRLAEVFILKGAGS